MPSASNLTNSTLGSELAINITDGKLFYKDNSNAVQVIAWKTTPTTAGGTGLTSYTAGDLTYYATGTALTKLAIGASGSWLGSSGTAPQWNAPAALTKTNDTNVTLTLGGSASTALLNAASLTLGWTGQLSAARGGTGIGSYAVGDILYANTTTTLAKLADVATGNALISGGVGVAPSWGKIGLTTHISGTLPTANGGTNLTSFTANGILYASSTSALATGSGLTFDGSNFATTGSATATRFIPSGSTVPTNGMYLGATNTVTFATNSTARFQFTSTGGGTWWSNSDGGGTNVYQIGQPIATFDMSDANGTVTAAIKMARYPGTGGGVTSGAGWVITTGLNTYAPYGAYSDNPTIKISGYETEWLAGNIRNVQTYSATVGATNRDLYVDNTGLFGYVTSTRESKTNIVPQDDVSWLMALEPVKFNRRKKEKVFFDNAPPIEKYSDEFYEELEYGLIADDAQNINQELCFYDVIDGQKLLRGVHYSKLITPILKLVQQQQQSIIDLQSQIAALKGTQ